MLDLELPDMSGLHFIARMREDERPKNTKIIVITADLPRVAKARQHADAVLVKPVDYALIMQALTDLLNSRRQQDNVIIADFYLYSLFRRESHESNYGDVRHAQPADAAALWL